MEPAGENRGAHGGSILAGTTVLTVRLSRTALRAREPFFTTRGATGGTGLGLAIARRITQEHGGAIRLESAPGEGTRVSVELPAAPPA